MVCFTGIRSPRQNCNARDRYENWGNLVADDGQFDMVSFTAFGQLSIPVILYNKREAGTWYEVHTHLAGKDKTNTDMRC